MASLEPLSLAKSNVQKKSFTTLINVLVELVEAHLRVRRRQRALKNGREKQMS